MSIYIDYIENGCELYAGICRFITIDRLTDAFEYDGTTFDNILDNNCGAITIDDNITTDELEYDSYEEATVAAEMLSLQNARVEEYDGKYKLTLCSEAIDCDGEHLKVEDIVNYGLLHTWEIVDITRDGQYLDISLKSGGRKECVHESANEKGQYIFYQLKAGKINGKYTVLCILDGIIKCLEVSGRHAESLKFAISILAIPFVGFLFVAFTIAVLTALMEAFEQLI